MRPPPLEFAGARVREEELRLEPVGQGELQMGRIRLVQVREHHRPVLPKVLAVALLGQPTVQHSQVGEWQVRRCLRTDSTVFERLPFGWVQRSAVLPMDFALEQQALVLEAAAAAAWLVLPMVLQLEGQQVPRLVPDIAAHSAGRKLGQELHRDWEPYCPELGLLQALPSD